MFNLVQPCVKSSQPHFYVLILRWFSIFEIKILIKLSTCLLFSEIPLSYKQNHTFCLAMRFSWYEHLIIPSRTLNKVKWLNSSSLTFDMLWANVLKKLISFIKTFFWLFYKCFQLRVPTKKFKHASSFQSFYFSRWNKHWWKLENSNIWVEVWDKVASCFFSYLFASYEREWLKKSQFHTSMSLQISLCRLHTPSKLSNRINSWWFLLLST